MSWSASFKSRQALENDEPEFSSSTDPLASFDQYRAAKRAALALIDSGVVGTEKEFHISVSGHSNPSHEPTPGWANDCVTVSVTQRAP